MTTTEAWTDPAGRLAELVAVAHPTAAPLAAEGYPEDYEDDGWFADFPGQRPPQSYELRSVVDGSVLRSDTVFPVEPWSWYDAIADRLVADGWTPPAPTEAELEECEHGLSAMLCSGPNHY